MFVQDADLERTSAYVGFLFPCYSTPGMIGKAERGPATIEALRQHRAVYLVAIGGAAYLVSKAVKSARIVAFGDLGMEAIYEFEIKDMPVTVAVDATGDSVHVSGPNMWRNWAMG